MDAAYIYGPDAVRLPATTAPYVAWTGQPRPRAEDCGATACRASRDKAWALADASYVREDATRRAADEREWDNAQLRAENAELRRQVAQLTRTIEGAA